MEDCKKISFVIPMFNSDKYIGACLNSILSTDLPKSKYEIVVVNDGSTDCGAAIVKQYIKFHDNIHLVEQENRGLSGARNAGVLNSSGEFIWFVDADDQLEGSLLPILKDLEQYDFLDILAVQLKVVTPSKNFLRMECVQPLVEHGRILSGRDAILQGYNPSSVCALITRRALIIDTNTWFVDRLTHQDVEFTYRIMPLVDQIIFTDNSPYLYVFNENSISKSMVPEKKIKYVSDDIIIINSFTSLANIYRKTDPVLAEKKKKKIKDIQFGLILSLFTQKKQWKKLGVNKAVLSLLKQNDLYPLKGDFGSFKKNIIAILLNIEVLIS